MMKSNGPKETQTLKWTYYKKLTFSVLLLVHLGIWYLQKLKDQWIYNCIITEGQ